MAHLLEEYSKNLGVKFSTPVVKDHFFPLSIDRYITISQEPTLDSKVYRHYDLVINLLKPFLQRAKIKVIQLGGRDKINGVSAALNVSFKQQSFILSNSLAHLGPDGALNHLASSKNIPTVTLFGNTFSQSNRPLFSKSSTNVSLEPEWDKKPSFSNVDGKRQIDKIKPEIIAQNILNCLNIQKEKINFSTKYIGDNFLTPTVEVVPTSFVDLRIPPNQLLSVRTDYGFDEYSFMQLCKKHKVSICADHLIQPQALQLIASNVNHFYIIIDRDWDTIPDSYFNTLKNLGIELTFLAKEVEDIPLLRNKYFDIPVRPYYQEQPPPCEVGEDTKFLSSLRIIEGKKEYLSHAHWKKGLDNNNKVVDTPDYWKELTHFYIYESKENSQEESS